MNIEIIEQLIAEETGLKTCPICGMPYKAYHPRQKTCGEQECKRVWHNKYLQERKARLIEEDPDEFRKYRREAMRKYRAKQKALKKRDEQLQELEERWDRVDEFDKRMAEYGLDYGKNQAEKVLANLPKVNTEIGGNNEKDGHDGNEERR